MEGVEEKDARTAAVRALTANSGPRSTKLALEG